MKRLVLAAILAVASPAWAQRLEVSPVVGYTADAPIDTVAAGVQDLTVNDTISWGGEALYFVTPRVGVGGVWTWQSSEVRLSTASASAELFRVHTNQVLSEVAYQFGDVTASLRPFVTGGFGVAFLTATDLEREAKASWTVAGGVTWYLRSFVGVKLQARYKPIILSDSSSEFCDPFGFCQRALRPFEIGAGAVFRF